MKAEIAIINLATGQTECKTVYEDLSEAIKTFLNCKQMTGCLDNIFFVQIRISPDNFDTIFSREYCVL